MTHFLLIGAVNHAYGTNKREEYFDETLINRYEIKVWSHENDSSNSKISNTQLMNYSDFLYPKEVAFSDPKVVWKLQIKLNHASALNPGRLSGIVILSDC